MSSRPTLRLVRPRLRVELSDRDLLQRIAAGDATALGALRTRHETALYALVFAIVNDVVDAEHVVSETLLEVTRHAAEFAGRTESVHALLRTLARSRAEVLRSARGRRSPTTST